jgi:hypothetical protein
MSIFMSGSLRLNKALYGLKLRLSGDINGRKSQGGHTVKAYSGPVSWKSYKQSMVALSTTEAE